MKNLKRNIKYVYTPFYKDYPKARFYILVIVLFSFLGSLVGSILSATCVDILANNKGLVPFIVTLTLLVVLIIIIDSTFLYCKNKYSLLGTFARIEHGFKDLIVKNITESYEYLEGATGKSVSNEAILAVESNWVGYELLIKSVPEVLGALFGLTIYTVYIGIKMPIALIILFAMMISSYFFTILYTRFEEKHNKEYRDKMMNSYALNKELKYSQMPSGKDIRLYNLQDKVLNIFKISNKELYKIDVKAGILNKLTDVSNTLFSLIRDIICFSILIKLVLDQKLSAAEFTLILGLFTSFTLTLNNFLTNLNSLKKANVELSRFIDFMDNDENNKEIIELDEKSLTNPLRITFEHVSYRYDGADKDVIKDLNLVIEPGEHLGLVGVNGAGKSTFIKLLCGLYRPKEGRILYGDIDISKLKQSDVTKLFSVVFQDSDLYSFKIKTNVSCKKDNDTNMDKVIKACIDAGIDEKIESMPLKYETFIGKEVDSEGISLSGGEKQKLLLARALYKDAPVLLLDEPTAALDAIAEGKMYDKYLAFSNNKTAVFISHRLSSTAVCDKIVFFKDGKIIEYGTHDELMNKKGEYFTMYDVQASYYKEGDLNEENA